MPNIRIGWMILAVLFSGAVSAGDIEAGKARAAGCQACHGPSGISPNPMWPNLAGQKDQYLIAQMKAYRSGERKNPLMSPMATALTDEDIDNLAAYYSGLSGS